MLSGTSNCANVGGRCGVRRSATVKFGLVVGMGGVLVGVLRYVEEEREIWR